MGHYLSLWLLYAIMFSFSLTDLFVPPCVLCSLWLSPPFLFVFFQLLALDTAAVMTWKKNCHKQNHLYYAFK